MGLKGLNGGNRLGQLLIGDFEAHLFRRFEDDASIDQLIDRLFLKVEGFDHLLVDVVTELSADILQQIPVGSAELHITDRDAVHGGNGGIGVFLVRAHPPQHKNDHDRAEQQFDDPAADIFPHLSEHMHPFFATGGGNKSNSQASAPHASRSGRPERLAEPGKGFSGEPFAVKIQTLLIG